MITATSILYLYTETPLHVGTGTGLSNVDLPIQRERTTGYPMIQGSGIKGKLRATAEFMQMKNTDIIFGSSRENTQTGGKPGQQDFAGSLIIGDARILLFPVRSLNGIFAYTTSYDVLQRFARDLQRSHIAFRQSWSIPTPIDESGSDLPTALVTSPSKLAIQDTRTQEKSLVLEEFSFKAQENEQVNNIATWLAENALPAYGQESTYWHDKLKDSLVILPNDDFRDFVLYATEVITRIRIERDIKIVKDGALWTEEHLPTDTLLYVPTYATNSRHPGQKLSGKNILEHVNTLNSNTDNYLQLGGDETVGRGIVHIRWGTIGELGNKETMNNNHANDQEPGEKETVSNDHANDQ